MLTSCLLQMLLLDVAKLPLSFYIEYLALIGVQYHVYILHLMLYCYNEDSVHDSYWSMQGCQKWGGRGGFALV